MKSSDAIKSSHLETGRKEVICMNEAQGTSLDKSASSSVPVLIYSNVSSTEAEISLNSGAKKLETPANIYCELEGVDTRRIQCDSEYEQLNHWRNPMIVYEQLHQL